jgi:hypothetical protein
MESMSTWASRSTCERSVPSAHMARITGSFVGNVCAPAGAAISITTASASGQVLVFDTTILLVRFPLGSANPRKVSGRGVGGKSGRSLRSGWGWGTANGGLGLGNCERRAGAGAGVGVGVGVGIAVGGWGV